MSTPPTSATGGASTAAPAAFAAVGSAAGIVTGAASATTAAASVAPAAASITAAPVPAIIGTTGLPAGGPGLPTTTAAAIGVPPPAAPVVIITAPPGVPPLITLPNQAIRQHNYSLVTPQDIIAWTPEGIEKQCAQIVHNIAVQHRLRTDQLISVEHVIRAVMEDAMNKFIEGPLLERADRNLRFTQLMDAMDMAKAARLLSVNKGMETLWDLEVYVAPFEKEWKQDDVSWHNHVNYPTIRALWNMRDQLKLQHANGMI